ncbi:hypothetical protein E1I69_07340 [Bacillus timonensis]|uniref:Uncharacterized protein n=1 Tax=Bacillus timonensis TaxID=1033734 RepID=A0A4S3PUF1_9BACI|nr:hypothetical protein [Bacillus timonensis]THE13421.1 hypothetical protein E1I69_07340 [Bacillus timonensis]
MSLTLTFCLTMLLVIAFFSTKMQLSILEQVFILFILVFIYTSFVSIICVNLELWEVSKKLQDLVAFRLYGVIYVPLTLLWLIDLWLGTKRNFYRSGFLLVCFFILLYIGDYILRLYGVYQFHDWNHVMLSMMWGFIFFFTLLAHQGFRLLLRKEGILS